MSVHSLLADTGDLIIKDGVGQEVSIKSPLRAEISDLSGLINVLVSFIFPLAAVILFAMLCYAGFVYISSEGSSDKVNQAKGIITSSIIGLILLFLAFFIIRIVSAIFGFEGGILPS